MAKAKRAKARARVKKSRSQKAMVWYHVGQMAFIGAIIMIVWLFTLIADAKGM